VVYKTATELCLLKDQLNLTDLDLSCLVEVCAQCPAPDKSLAVVLQLLIDKTCAIETLVNAGSGGSTPTPTLLTVAQCFRGTDLNGDPVTSYSHSDYTLKIGIEVCRILGIVNQHSNTITNHEVRIKSLETKPATTYTPPTVIPNCVVTPVGVPTQMDVVLEAMEEQFCQFRAAVGTPTQISTALAKQCAGLAQFSALSTTGTLGNISGFVTGTDPMVNTIAGTLSNLWIAFCDLRTAVVTMKNTINALDCSSVIIDFTVAASGSNGARDQITLFFAGLTSIANTLSECSQQGSKLTVADAAGNTYVTYIQVVANKANGSGVIVNLASSNINTSLNYTITLEACVKNAANESCTKQVVKTLFAPCTNITINSATIS
jgi:hypothetical protein